MDAIWLEALSFSSIPAIIFACVLVPLISYLIYKFSIKEKSFEEVLEEQKRQNQEEELRLKSEKSKKKEKFKRSWSKKKEKSEVENIAPAITTSSEDKKEIPLIIEPKESKSGKLKKNKQQPAASLTENVGNTSDKSVKQDFNVSNKTTEDAKETAKIKKDAPQVKKEVSSEKKEAVSKEKEVPSQIKKDQEKSKMTSKSEDETKSLEVESKILLTTPAGSSVQTSILNKKKKKESVDTNLNILSASKLFQFVKEVVLDTDEIQKMIDILLNKQKDSAEWTKPHDPLTNTKKVLQEKEQRLEHEVKQNQVLMSKVKEQKDENNQLKALDKTNQEKIAKLQGEILVYQNRFKQLQDECALEKEKNLKIKQVDEKRKLDDTNAKVPQKVSKPETETKPMNNKSEIDSLKASKEQLQKAHTLLTEQHIHIMSTHKNEVKKLNAQIIDLQKKLEEVSAKNSILAKDILKLTESKASLENAKLTAEEKVVNEKKHSAELEAKIKQMSSNSANMIQLQTEIKDLQLENDRLTEQLVSTKERVAGDGQEIIHQNGEVNGAVPDESALKDIEEKAQLLKEKESDIFKLNEEVSQLKAKLNPLVDENELQKKKNNELREKNWKAMEALKMAEERYKELESSVEKRVAETQKELQSKLTDATHSSELELKLAKSESDAAKSLADYKSEVDKTQQLTLQVDSLLAEKQSAELRLSALEKTVEELSCQVKECHCQTRECLQRIHPEISVDSSLPHETWVEEFEKLVLLSSKVTAPSSSDAEISKLNILLEEKESEKAQSEQTYQKMLSDLEVTLHNLEASAELKESKWQEKLEDREAELKKLLLENEAAQSSRQLDEQLKFQQLDQLKELKEELKELKETLNSSESKVSQLEQRYEEVNKNCINLRDQLENKVKQVEELQRESNSAEHLRQIVEDLKEKLEKEKKINKDFSSQMVRLNSLVKIGQDSLAAEQEMVKKLKSQLEALQASSTNGGTGISSAVKQTESLPRTKGSEKSKKKSDASGSK